MPGPGRRASSAASISRCPTGPSPRSPAERDLPADAIHREGKVMAVAFGDFSESYRDIHARQIRPASPRPAPAARCNLPVAAADFPGAGHPCDVADYAGRATPSGEPRVCAVRQGLSGAAACRCQAPHLGSRRTKKLDPARTVRPVWRLTSPARTASHPRYGRSATGSSSPSPASTQSLILPCTLRRPKRPAEACRPGNLRSPGLAASPEDQT